MLKKTQKYHFVKLVFLALSLPFLFITLQADDVALTYSADDKKLEWGPCPPFIPEGCQIAVLHGNPSKNNVDLFFKVPGNFAIPYHWHTSAERMMLVSGKLKVTYDNHETELLESGMYAYGPSKLPHTAFCEKGDPCVIFIAFEEPLDAFEVMKATK